MASQQSPPTAEDVEEAMCTTCPRSGSVVDRHHPQLEVPMCPSCYKRCHIYDSTKDLTVGACLWCRRKRPDHEMAARCMSCDEGVCRACICKNFGAAVFKKIRKMGKTWKCFFCDREQFELLCSDFGLKHRLLKTTNSAKAIDAPVRGKKRVICADISNGLENIAIPVINDVDKEPTPSTFTYIVQNVLGSGTHVISGNPNFMTCCSCKNNCSDPKVCECAIAMAGHAYDRDNHYFADKPGGVYECNYLCSCHQDLCRNRLVGNGPNIPLEVFRCREVGKGWGVRCCVDIPLGTFIADYLGEVLNEVDAERRVDADEYLFGMDAFARSHACQVLTDVGLKKIDPPSPALYSNVASTSRQSIVEAAGVEVASRIFERPKIIPLIDYEADSNLTRDSKNSKQQATPTYLDIIRSTGTRKRDINKLLGSSSDLAAAAVEEESETGSLPYVIRKKQLRTARAILMERAMIEAETKNITYTLDANHYGNVARFLNHSCTPNLEKVTVFTDSQDVRLPKVALFSNQLIPAGTELCYDYGYFQGNVEGKHRKCLCKSEKCRGNMY